MTRCKSTLFALCIILLSACQTEYKHTEGKIFGTYYNVTYQSDEDLSEVVLEALKKVDGSLSMFNPESTVSKLNNNSCMELDEAFNYLFYKALEVSEATDGAFDITVAPLVNAWGFGFKTEELPTNEAIDSLMQFVGISKVQVIENKLVKSDPRIMVDLSAIAKGYGVDVVAQALDEHGVQNYMVEIGGEVITKGFNPQGKAWRIGLASPTENGENSNGYECILQLTDCALATSGNYRNYYDKDGVRYAHTIDPRTGRPIQHDIISSTVVAPHCFEADAYATAFMVLGVEKAMEVLENQSHLEAYLIYLNESGEQEVYCTSGFPDRLALH